MNISLFIISVIPSKGVLFLMMLSRADLDGGKDFPIGRQILVTKLKRAILMACWLLLKLL